MLEAGKMEYLSRKVVSMGPVMAEKPLRTEPKEWYPNGGRPGCEHRAPTRRYLRSTAQGLSVLAGGC